MTTMQIIIAGAWLAAFGATVSKTVSSAGMNMCLLIALVFPIIGMVI